MESRHFPHPLDLNHDVVISSEEIAESISRYWSWVKNSPVEDSWRVSDGVGGMVVAALYCSRYMEKEKWGKLLNDCVNRLCHIKLDSRKNFGTFVEGNTGAYVCMMFSGKHRHEMLEKLLHTCDLAINSETIPFELWYGLSGMMYSLSFAQKEFFSNNLVAKKEIHNRLKAMYDKAILNGRGKATKEICLYFEWHDTCYFGLVHGYAGIISTLIEIYETEFDENEKEERRSSVDELYKMVEWLETKRLNSNNFPSSKDSKSDKLVQICHGNVFFPQNFLTFSFKF